MDDPQVFLHRLPHLWCPLFDRYVASVRVREPDGFSPKVMVQVGLLRIFQPEVCRLQLGHHVLEDLGRRVEEEDPGVEARGEPWIVHINVRDGSELERQVPYLVKVPADDGVCVEVHGGLDPDLVERPDVQFRVLVDEGVVDVLPSTGWGDKVDGVELPACGLDEAQRPVRDAIGEVDEDSAGVDVALFDGVAEDGQREDVGVCVHGRNHRALVGTGLLIAPMDHRKCVSSVTEPALEENRTREEENEEKGTRTFFGSCPSRWLRSRRGLSCEGNRLTRRRRRR